MGAIISGQGTQAQPGRSGNRWWNVLALAIAIILVTPLLVIAANLFVPGGDAWQHLSATVLPDYARNSIILVTLVGAGTVLVGAGSAWLVTRCDFPGRRFLEWALILPLAMPAYVIAYAYTDLLQFSGPVQSALRGTFGWSAGDYWFPEVRSLGGAAAMFIAVLYPYVYLLSRSAFLEQSPSLADASRTLGLSAWQAFWRVNLPLARPAIAAGAALACMETLADYGTVSYFGVQTFTTGIFRAWLSLGEPVSAARLSVMLLGFVAVLITIERLARRRSRFHESAPAHPHLRTELRGGLALAALAGCCLPLTVGFAVPAAILVHLAIAVGDAQFGSRFSILAWNSLALATLTATVAVALAALMAFGARLSRSSVAAAVNRFAGLGYAVPGAVVAVGVLTPAAWLDNRMGSFLEATIGWNVGLVLTGSIAALVYAYLIRFLAVALQAVEAGLSKITPSMEDAARALGHGTASSLARVHVPLMRSSLVTAALLVFVDVMKELPATFVMRPFDFDTLAVQAFNLASDERLAEASTASLAIVAVGLAPLILASRRMVRQA